MKQTSYKYSKKELETVDGLSLKPIKIGNVPKMAVLLGLMSPKYYEVYQECDGNTDLKGIGQKVQLNDEQIRLYIDKLIKSKMVRV